MNHVVVICGMCAVGRVYLVWYMEGYVYMGLAFLCAHGSCIGLSGLNMHESTCMNTAVTMGRHEDRHVVRRLS